MLVSVGLGVSAHAIASNENVARGAHEDVPERQAPRGQLSRHRRENWVSRNQAQTLARGARLRTIPGMSMIRSSVTTFVSSSF